MSTYTGAHLKNRPMMWRWKGAPTIRLLTCYVFAVNILLCITRGVDPNTMSTRTLTFTGLFTALHIAASLLLRFGGEAVIPFSLVPLFVMLAGSLLGRKGALSLIAYTLLGLAGLPVFSSPPYGGLSYLLVPSFGFVIGFIFSAYIIGLLVERTPHLTWQKCFAFSAMGLIPMYAVGLPYLHTVLRIAFDRSLTLQQLLAVGFYPFILLDLFKAALAALLAVKIRKRLPLDVARRLHAS